VRGFALADARWSATLARVQAGVRVDAMTGAGALPSFSLAAERAVTSHWTLAGRVTQAMRAPTLYDLYFASPQRVEVRALKPERVIADGEISLRFARTTTFGFIQSSVAMVARNTRDAIVWFPGNFGWSPANVGRERVVGGEVNVALTSGWGEFATWATAYDATLTVGALSIPTPYVPRVATGSRLVAHWRSATVAATSRTMSRRPFSAGPRNRDYELPAVTLLDLALTHESPLHLAPTIATTFTWTVENALDTSWQSVRGFPSPGRTWSVTCTLRHSPRS
jgi:outer membrane cobalamin receptor